MNKLKFNEAVENNLLKKGMYRITACNATDENIAPINQGFANNPDFKRDWFSDIAFIAFNISIITNTVKERVDAFAFPDIKYLQGSAENSYPKNGCTEKSFQFGHWAL